MSASEIRTMRVRSRRGERVFTGRPPAIAARSAAEGGGRARDFFVSPPRPPLRSSSLGRRDIDAVPGITRGSHTHLFAARMEDRARAIVTLVGEERLRRGELSSE